MSSTLMILISITTMAILSGEAFGAMPTQCNSEFLEELPPRLRKICVAIARIWDPREMNDFLDDRGDRINITFFRKPKSTSVIYMYIIFVCILIYIIDC